MRRACLPSMASSVWYMKRHQAFAAITAGGGVPSPAAVKCQFRPYTTTRCSVPTSVTRLGAMLIGRRSVAQNHHGLSRLSSGV